MTVTSVLRLRPRAGRADEFARTFVELDIFEHSRRSGGFLDGRLLRPLEGGEPFVVVAEWENTDAYQGWLDNPVREVLGEKLEPLLDEDVASGQLYEEVR
jgi:heme-degrading monooxygenase HmoA